MPDLSKIYLFRMIHIENIPHILKYGITHSSSVNANPAFRSIGDSSVISTRNSFLLNNGKRLGEYIPFYFGVRTPMLYVIQHGFNMVEPIPPEKIVYFISSVEKIIEYDHEFVFTDGHAIDSFSTQYLQADVENINEILDWEAINARYWKNEDDLDRKRRKEAEFLVLDDIDVSGILGYIVYNQGAKEKMLNFGLDEEKVLIKSDYYF